MRRIDDLLAEMCPDGVKFRKLGELGTLFGGLTGKSKADFQDGNARFVTYMNVFNNIATDVGASDFVRVLDSERQRQVRRGDVLFTGSSETAHECGMSSVVTTDVSTPLYLNSFCIGYRFHDPELFNPDFSKHMFRSSSMRRQIVRTANGVTRFNVSKARLAQVLIPIPPIDIQGEIAHRLDQFTQLEAELEAELEARRRQYEYYRYQLLLFEGEDVPRVPLGDLGEVSMCKRIYKAQTSPDGDVPFYKIGTFGSMADAFIPTDLFEDYRRRYPFPNEGDVLISAAGTVGRAVVYDGEPAYFQDSNIVWVANDESRVTNRFLFHIYQIANWATDSSTITRLYNDNLRRLMVPVPPLEEQERVVAILDRLDALVNDLSIGLPAELAARRKQYEYYRDRLLTFPERAA